MERFLRKLFWIGGIVLVVLGALSFYVRYQTLKYDMRLDRGDALEIRR